MSSPSISVRAIATAILIILSTVPTHADSLQLPGTSKWIVVSSRVTFEEARSASQPFLKDPDGVRIVRAKNGRFAVVLGPTRTLNVEVIKSTKNVPSDTYLSSGTNFIDTVWLPTLERQVIVREVAKASQIGLDASRCVGIPYAKSRLACYDEVHSYTGVTIVDAPAVEAVSRQPQQTESQPERISRAVMPASQTLSHRSQDIMDGVGSDRIEMRVAFTNKSDRLVIGVSHRFSISNAFGEVVHSGQDNLDMRIEPMQTMEAPMYYYWEDNPFIPGETYDKLQGPLANSTYKIEDKILKIIYADGTSEEMSSLQ